MFWICEFVDSLTAKDSARHIAAREQRFLMFKRKKDAKKYLYEVLNHSDEYIKDCVYFEKSVSKKQRNFSEITNTK